MAKSKIKIALTFDKLTGAPGEEPWGLQRSRKQDSRGRLLKAAIGRFSTQGYFAVSVEDIAAEAGLSRMTYYRHFSGKAALAAELFGHVAKEAMPRYLKIGQVSFRDRSAVNHWIADLFEADRTNRRLLRVFTQAAADGSEFVDRAQNLIVDLIYGLGATIPAFAIRSDVPRQRRRWLEAWLLVYEILDQSNHAALESRIATDPLVIDILADRFLTFISADN